MRVRQWVWYPELELRQMVAQIAVYDRVTFIFSRNIARWYIYLVHDIPTKFKDSMLSEI
jgi:hypothetical protein